METSEQKEQSVEIKVGYLCTTVTTVNNGHRSSNGWAHSWHTSFICDGLKTDCPQLNFTVQDYEKFLEIEKELKPKDYQDSGSGSDNSMGEEPGIYSESSYQSLHITKALNDAFAAKFGVHFMVAEYGKDNLIYDFNETIGASDFSDFENIKNQEEHNRKCEIAVIEKQIQKLEIKKQRLLWCTTPNWFSKEMVDVLKEIVNKGRIGLNTKIQSIQKYPLDVAYLSDKELYEQMLKMGAVQQSCSWFLQHPLDIHSWYGFFKFLSLGKTYLSEEKVDVVIGELPLLSDNQISEILLIDNPRFEFEDIVLGQKEINLIRDYIIDCSESKSYTLKVDEGLLTAFDNLLSSKRYEAINIIKDFVETREVNSDLDVLLFVTCLKNRSLEGLKYFNVKISIDYFRDANWYVVVDAVKQFYNEDYIGSEMMQYIKSNMTRPTKKHIFATEA